jgi:hypothetical protein
MSALVSATSELTSVCQTREFWWVGGSAAARFAIAAAQIFLVRQLSMKIQIAPCRCLER